jgi:hypothetical protein
MKQTLWLGHTPNLKNKKVNVMTMEAVSWLAI